MQTLDMFDINGADKLEYVSVRRREEIIRHYAQDPHSLFFVSLSGGKDGQAMYHVVRKMVPDEKIVIVHAHLGTVEHDGVIDHIERTTVHPLNIVRNENKDFVDMVLLRGMFPSPQFRQCTSDLKNQPIQKFIRHTMKERGARVGFNCVGLRALESAPRGKRNPLWINKSLTLKSGIRTVYDWLPVFHLSEEEVFHTIEVEAGQEAHSAYGQQGARKNRRLSCVFCIMGCENDLVNGALDYTEHYHEMIALQRVVLHTMFSRKAKGEIIKVTLEEKAGVAFDEALVEKHYHRLVERRDYLLANQRRKKAQVQATREDKKRARTKGVGDDKTLGLFAA